MFTCIHKGKVNNFHLQINFNKSTKTNHKFVDCLLALEGKAIYIPKKYRAKKKTSSHIPAVFVSKRK